MASVLYQGLYPEQVTVDAIHAWYNIAYAAMESGALEEADSLYALCENELESEPDAVHGHARHSAIGQPCVAADSSFSRDLYDAALFSKTILLWTSSQWRNRAISALDSETQSLWAEWQRLQKEDGQDAMAELEKSMDILRLEHRVHQQLGQEDIYERLASLSIDFSIC